MCHVGVTCVNRRLKMSSFSVQALRDKFSRLSGSQESIETLSLWIIHHKQDAATTVAVWFEDIKSSRKFVNPFQQRRSGDILCLSDAAWHCHCGRGML